MLTTERIRDRILHERIAGPQIVQDGRAVRPGGGGAGAWPTERKVITEAETYLTRDDCGKLIWVDGVEVDPAPSILWLPLDPVVNKTLWICMKLVSDISIRPSRETAIRVPAEMDSSWYPVDTSIYGYWFDYKVAGGDRAFQRGDLHFSYPHMGSSRLTWVVMTYTGEVQSISSNYVDSNSNDQYDPGEEILYRDITLWNCWRLSGEWPLRLAWRSDSVPFYD